MATDLAKALEHDKATRITRLLDPDQKGDHLVATPGGTQTLISLVRLRFVPLADHHQQG